MYTIRHISYCGLVGIPEGFETDAESRAHAAQQLRRFRREFRVVILARGISWEIQEPEHCVMVPDMCGTLTRRRIIFECKECGSECDTREVAAQCCNPCEWFCTEEE